MCDFGIKITLHKWLQALSWHNKTPYTYRAIQKLENNAVDH